jgi:AcrR family transcriptional regulator
MRVEQRIGRIDRIGQKANTIVVINLLTKGTIDASIYHHLHTKIGLFKETVGDLEGIIGEQLNALTRELLLDELNEAQTDERVRQTALAFENTRMLETEVNQQSENLVGLRGALQESVNRDRSFGRFVKSLELKRFIDDFLSLEYSGDSGFSLGWDTPETDCLSLKLGFRARGDFEAFLNMHRISRPKGFNNDGSCILTFDPEVHARVKGRHRHAQNINHLHPLVRWIAHERSEKAEKWHPVSALTVNSSAVPAGNYFYLIARISFDHPILKRQELIHRVQGLSLEAPLTKDQSELLMQEALEHGDSWHQRGSFEGASEGLSQLREACDEHYLNIETEFFNELELRRNSKLQQVRAHFGSRIEATERTIQTIRLKPEGERRGLSGFEARLARLQENYQASLGRIESQEPDTDYKIICAGLLRVQNSTLQPALP